MPAVSLPAIDARPMLTYQRACDLCAALARRHGGAVALFAGSPFYARELFERLDRVWLIPGSAVVAGKAPPADIHGRLHGPRQLAPTVVWAGARNGLPSALHYLEPGGRLYLIAEGWLLRCLPGWRQAGAETIALTAAERLLRQVGLLPGAHYGIYGIQSALWGVLAGWSKRAGREDAADRCYAMMRARLMVKSTVAQWPALNVVAARMPGSRIAQHGYAHTLGGEAPND